MGGLGSRSHRNSKKVNAELDVILLATSLHRTFPFRGRGVFQARYSTPTQDSMPRALGRTPAGGESLSSLSFSMAWKHLDMCIMTCTTRRQHGLIIKQAAERDENQTSRNMTDPGRAVAIGQNVQEISGGNKVESWESTALALHVVSESLLADLELSLLLLEVLHQPLLVAATHSVLGLLEAFEHLLHFFVNASKANGRI